jgi:hypothetical protein
MVHGVHYTIYTVYCTLYTVYYILLLAYTILYTIYYYWHTLYSVHYPAAELHVLLLLSLLHCRYHHTTQQLNYMYALAIMRDYERRQGERAINRGSTVDPVYGKVSGLQVQPV